MKAKKLNLEQALLLASIISKYVDSTNLSVDAVDFIAGIVEKITPGEYLQCIKIITDITEEEIKEAISIDLLTAFIEGLKLNQVVTLVSFWKSLNAQ